MQQAICMYSTLPWKEYSKAQSVLIAAGDMHIARCGDCRNRLMNDPEAVVTTHSLDELVRIDTAKHMH